MQARNLDLDLCETIAEISQEILVKRQPKGAYSDKGRWIAQSPTEIKINGSVQVARPEDLVNLDEGIRTKEAIKIYTPYLLRTANVELQTQADVILWQDKEYEVVSVYNWSDVGGYFKAVASRRAH